jgi:hypothetical protein
MRDVGETVRGGANEAHPVAEQPRQAVAEDPAFASVDTSGLRAANQDKPRAEVLT